MRRILEGREFSKCRCGAIKSAHAKQCRECYKKNGGRWDKDNYLQPSKSVAGFIGKD